MNVDWKNEGWVRLYRRSTPEWLAVPWQARSFFDELLKLAEYLGPDRGLVRLGPKGLKAIAGAVHWPLDVVESAVAALLEDGCVERTDRGLMIKNYIPAQDAIKSASLKNKDYRARLRNVETRPEVSDVRPEVSKPRPSETGRDATRPGETQEEEKEEEQELPPIPPTGGSGSEAGKIKPADVRRVFGDWQRLHATTRAKLDPKRDRRIRARLGEGFTPDDLERALKGATHDDWLMGRRADSARDYRGLETLLRDAAQVERLIALWQQHEGGGSETPEARADRERRADLLAKADAALAGQRAKADVPIAGPGRGIEGAGDGTPVPLDLSTKVPAVNGRPGGRGSASLAMAFPAAAPKASQLEAEWAEYAAEAPGWAE